MTDRSKTERGSGPSEELSHTQVQYWLQSGEALAPQNQQRVEMHLKACSDCREYAVLIERLKSELAASVPSFARSEQQRQENIRQIQEQIRKKSDRRPARLGVQWAVLVIVGLLFIAGLSWILKTFTPQPGRQGIAPLTRSERTGTPILKPTATPMPLPQPPATDLDLGYLPLAGFFNRSADHVLSAPLVQEANGDRLTVEQGLASPTGTRLWLHYSGEMPAFEQAWLEDAGGQRLPVGNYWINYNQDDPNLVMLEFPALAEPSQATTLGLNEGWRLPVQFATAADLSLASASLPSAVCLETPEAWLCLLAAARKANGLSVLIQQLPQPGGPQNLLPVDETTINPFDSFSGCALRLDAGQGGAGDWRPCQPSRSPATTADIPGAQSLSFTGLSGLNGAATLEIPVVRYSLPLSESIAIDLGLYPQIGQTWEVDLPVQVDGLEVHFTQAALVEDGTGLPRLELTSQPVQARDGRIVTSLEIGKPEGIVDRFGYGFDSQTRQHTINVALASPEGQVFTGLLTIPIVSAQISRIGPFGLTWQLSETMTAAELPPPLVIGAETFVQPTPAALLPLDGFSYTGRPLRSGEVLLVAQKDGLSNLYVASPSAPDAPEWIAALPGLVFRVTIHPDRGGLDYLVAESNQDGALSQARLFTLRLDGSSPVEQLGPLPFVDTALWSADGGLLFYTARHSQNGETKPMLVDLATCRASPQGCAQANIPFSWKQGTVTLNCPAWSTRGTKMAFCGTDENGNGSGGLYVGEFSAHGEFIGLNGPLQPPTQGHDFSPAWLPGDTSIIYVCEDGLEFNICIQRLDGSQSELLLESKSALVPLMISPDGSKVALPGYLAKGQSMRLRLLDIASHQVTDLPETGWIAGFPPAFSPDGRWVLAITGNGGVPAFNVQDGEQIAFSNQLPAPVQWAGWVP